MMNRDQRFLFFSLVLNEIISSFGILQILSSSCLLDFVIHRSNNESNIEDNVMNSYIISGDNVIRVSSFIISGKESEEHQASGSKNVMKFISNPCVCVFVWNAKGFRDKDFCDGGKR